ncbi:MAG TPA: hypothetical protein VFQ68_17450 [Streptosporangiaceae bacterium]|nr:hypothetical protein [Streptosporangiaceae bacterium]
MTASDHARSPLARLALAAGGVGVLLALAAAMRYAAGSIGGARGTLAAVLLAGAVFSGCRLAHGLRPRRAPGLTRPGPVRLPEAARDLPEPAGSPS